MPIMLGIPALVSGVSGIFAAAYGLFTYTQGKSLDEIHEDVNAAVLGWIVEHAATRAGLALDPEDPLSDASFAGALSQKTGITIRSLKDRDMIREDVDMYAAQVVSDRSGYLVHSVSNVAVLKADLQRIAAALLSDRLGIPAGVLPGDGEEFDAAAVKERLLSWAKAELMTRVNEEVAIHTQEIMDAGGLEEIAADMNSRLASLGSVENVTARQLAVQVATRLATGAVVDFGKVAKGMSKRTRRQLQLRDAQKKFRATHGNRQQYVPLGMVGTVE